MRRLCVFYYKAAEWQGKPVQWIVCTKCRAKIRHCQLTSLLKDAARRAQFADSQYGSEK
jgi:hypothetical protein